MNSRVLLAHAQRLTEQIKTANARIKDLEHALSDAQAQTGGKGPHPLLREAQDIQIIELETIYDDVDGILDVSDTIGSLSIGPDAKARYYGETAGSEVGTSGWYRRSILTQYGYSISRSLCILKLVHLLFSL